ncbi:hypothetical protein QVE09_16235 [Paenibacillus sp. ClWae2A]|uniref:hypothetical protein n=1 Tax=Paenibacillus sp. ClWae2A TaxID=3057177 RepID=UPI0028F5D2C1|nr:hypothetical protein [Paenibacillus sp. ClWae2A]MDT9720468.1 hypothetical protein [Paenibacillus sp. ClWae2A]
MDRINDRHKHMFAKMRQAFVRLSESFANFANAIQEHQGVVEMLELIEQYDEQPAKTKPLRLRDLPRALPMRHQVLNRKPVLQVARSRC